MPSPKSLLTDHDIHPKQSLGQNFLCDPQAAEAIVRHSGIGSTDTVVEIGAGTGALTVPAARAADRVFAVETDGRLIEPLTETIKKNGRDNVVIIKDDFMAVDLSEIFHQAGEKRLFILGNLPYYLSSQILVRLIHLRRYIGRAVLMFQQELAERITAAPGGRQYGRLSVMLRYCAEVKQLMRIRKELFYPRPKVESTVIRIDFKHDPEENDDDDLLFAIIKAAFAQRRKTIRNALVSGRPDTPPPVWETVLRQAGIAAGIRAETLDAGDYLNICRYYEEITGNSNTGGDTHG